MPSITLINNAEHKALTTVYRLKVFLGIGTDRHDALLTLLINQVTQFIEQYTKRRFLSQTYTNEKYDGTGTKELLLKNFPVSSITSLQQNLNPDNSDNWETIDSGDYFPYLNEGRIVAYSYTFDKFLQYPQKYRATYVAGYPIDFDNENTVASHTLPPEIEYACQKLCSALFNTRRAEGFSATRTGDQSVTLSKTLFDSEEIRAILDKYTNPTIA